MISIDFQPPSYPKTTKPFLFIQCRPAGAIADDERQVIAELGQLEIGESLVSRMLLEESDLDPATDLDLAGDYSAVIISGSPFGAREPKANAAPDLVALHRRVMDLATVILERDLPCLALCYGLQLIGQAAGTKLSDAYAEDLQAVRVTLTEEGETDPVTSQLASQSYAFVGHADSLAETPKGAVLLGRGDFCENQLVRFGKNIYGTQFHPEITTEGMRFRIDAYGNAYYAAEEKAAVEARCLTKDVTSGNTLISAFVNHYRQ